jgi:4-hydroxy-tetrahydrodipicolinate synthase
VSAGKLTEHATGVYIIAATPFTDDGALDLQSVDTLTDFYLGCGVHGLTLLGMMGEAHKLTTEESIDVVKRVIARAGDRQVIVGVSNAGIGNIRRLAHEVMIAGAAGVMIAPPAGLKGDDGIYNYYVQIFAVLGPDIPVVYQDYPQVTGVYLPPRVFERLVDDFRQLVMLKHEDAPGLAKLTRIREDEKKPGRRRVSILVGNGRRGADGAMTGFAWPEMLVEVYDLFTAGKVEEAEDLFDIYLPLVRHEVQPRQSRRRLSRQLLEGVPLASFREFHSRVLVDRELHRWHWAESVQPEPRETSAAPANSVARSACPPLP